MSLFNSPAGIKFLDLITYPKINIEENSFTFITGKSGCGKSTFLKILNRTVIPSCGSVLYKGKEIQSYPVLDYRREVTLVPQGVFLIDGSVRENFDFYYDAREKQHLSDDKMLEFMNICCADFPVDADCSRLSGGERQRIFLSIFLSCIPPVLMLDEPTAALDKQTSFELFENIKAFCKKQKITAICVCHNDEMVKSFAEHIIHLGEQQ